MSDPDVEYLTPAWGEALQAGANAAPAFRAAVGGLELAIGQEISPEGEADEAAPILYTLRFADGSLTVEWGTIDGADVVFALSPDTARRMHDGTLNAQQAFVLGKLAVRGNPERLLGARDAFLQLTDVFGELRARVAE